VTRSASTSRRNRFICSTAKGKPWHGRSERSEFGLNTILHIGLGAFHRAHQAAYLQRLHATGEHEWSIVGANVRDDMAETMAALMAQHGAYTLETVSPAGMRQYERIDAIREVISFEPTHTRVIDVGADPSTRIISFTVTEAGYYLDAGDRLDTGHADLVADLEGRTCGTIYGAIAAIARERVRRGGAPVTLLNCDNLRSNGERFRAGLLDFLERRGETALRDWVRSKTSSPNGMVDRITPRPPPELAERVRAATGWNDRAPVMAETFTQWVIEDQFIASRPAWESVGVEMVSSVHAHEEAKIRLLNATHSGIAWAGTLRGLNYIHEGVRVPEIRQIAHDYATHDVIPCLDTPARPSTIDLPHYRDVVLERFSNPWLHDTNQRVAMDGFSKILGFIVPTLRECLARGASIASTAMLPALFFAVLGRWHRGELAYAYHDGVMDPAVAHTWFLMADPLAAFCRDALLWGPLAGNQALEAAIRAADQRVRSFING
jgi:D-arabinitol 4-dehydrogenase